MHLQCVLEAVAPVVVVDPPVADANPLRGLLHVVLNAVLYSVSAGVEAEVRYSPKAPRARAGASAQPFSSEEVYFLPGAIEISRVRQMQEAGAHAQRATAAPPLHGPRHWRRPAPDWRIQRMRWIEPYWKGPDIAAVIERTYRLEP